MTENPVLTDEMKSRIGIMLEPVMFEVEKGAIKRFAHAVGDSNPLYEDDEYARKYGYRDVICPPGFFGWPSGAELKPETLINLINAPLKNILNLGNEMEFHRTIYPGDTLVCYQKIADIQEKASSKGSRLFVVFESIFKNQDDYVVAVMRYNMMLS